MATVIMTDSTSDITAEHIKELGVYILPVIVNFGEKSYRDTVDINTRQFFDMLRESEVNPTTSQPTPRDFLAVFEQFKQKGDEVVYIGVSSALSGTLQSARIAADMSGYDKIYIVDSLSATLGLEILVRYACKLRDMGKNGAQVARAVEEKVPKGRLIAVVDTLKYLVRGGRISKAAGVIGGALGIKPLVSVVGGKVDGIGKARGQKNAFDKLCEMLKSADIDKDMPCIVANADDVENMRVFEKFLRENGIDLQWTNSEVGSVVGTHVGPGCVGIAYFEK